MRSHLDPSSTYNRCWWSEKTTRVGQGPLNQTVGCCTWRRIGPVGVDDKVGRHAMEVAGKTKIGVTKKVSTIVLDPPDVGGVKLGLETGIRKPTRNAGIVVRKAIERATAGRNTPIRINLDPARLDKETNKFYKHTFIHIHITLYVYYTHIHKLHMYIHTYHHIHKHGHTNYNSTYIHTHTYYAYIINKHPDTLNHHMH